MNRKRRRLIWKTIKVKRGKLTRREIRRMRKDNKENEDG